MKKILLATSALVALSGAAAAEVTFSGDARVALKFDNRISDADVWDAGSYGTMSGTDIISRARLHITMTGESDAGLSFGAKFRADQASNAVNNTKATGVVWMEGAYGKLEVGDVDPAIEKVIGDFAYVGASNLEELNEIWYNGYENYGHQDNKGVTYTYNYGDVALFASFQDRYASYNTPLEGRYKVKPSWSLGVKYDITDYYVGVGFSKDGVTDNPLMTALHAYNEWIPELTFADEAYDVSSKTWGVVGGGEVNDFAFKALYTQTKVDVPTGFPVAEKIRQYGLGGEYDLGNGTNINGFWRRIDVSDVAKADILALGAGYDLGGGAEVRGGVAHTKVKSKIPGLTLVNSSRTIADVGVVFKF